MLLLPLPHGFQLLCSVQLAFVEHVAKQLGILPAGA
jgi:hypothetical protein